VFEYIGNRGLLAVWHINIMCQDSRDGMETEI
jgi:hypothetical protein